jgi:DNA-binding NarL/FixJ family response regulator
MVTSRGVAARPAPSRDELLHLLYETVSSPVAWSGFLRCLLAATGASATNLVVMDAARRGISLSVVETTGEELPRSTPFFALVELWLDCRDRAPLGCFLDDEAILGAAGAEPVDALSASLRRLASDHHVLLGTILDGDGILAGLSLLRPRRSGRFGPEALVLLDDLGRHLERALRVGRRCAERESLLALLRCVIDQSVEGLIVVDAELRVQFANGRGARILADTGCLGIRDGYLHSTSKGIGARLIDAVRTVSAQDHPDHEAAVMVPRLSRSTPLEILIAKPPDPPPSGGPGSNVLIFVRDPDHSPQVSTRVLRSLYKLTEREAELACLLVREGCLQDAATELEMSITTARTHLRSIFTKLGIRRQAELVRRISSGVAGVDRDS